MQPETLEANEVYSKHKMVTRADAHESLGLPLDPANGQSPQDRLAALRAATAKLEASLPAIPIPRNEQVLVLPDEQTDKSPGGIYLPDSAKKKPPCRGTVKAIGPGAIDKDGSRVPIADLALGDAVLFNHFKSNEFETDGVTFSVMPEDAIVLRLKAATEEQSASSQPTRDPKKECDLNDHHKI